MKKSKRKIIYLDNAATSHPKPPSVVKAVNDALLKYGGNPGRGTNSMALQAYRKVFQVREKIADFFGIDDSSRIIFTSNATEALNLAIKGMGIETREVITSPMEHNSVIRPLALLKRQGVEVKKVKASERGEIDPDDVKKIITKKTRLAVFTHSSNVLGTIVPINEIGKICKEYGVVFLVDAAQSAGHIPIDVKSSSIDLLAASGHKGLFGMQGTGFLYISPDVSLIPLKEGGTGSFSESENQPDELPDKFESGTLNTPGIVSLGAGIDYIKKKGGIEAIAEKEKNLINKLIDGIKDIDRIELYGLIGKENRLGVLSLNIKNRDPMKVSEILDKKFGIITRAGIHCAPDAHRLAGTFPNGTVRLSPGIFNSEKDIDKTIKVLHILARKSVFF